MGWKVRKEKKKSIFLKKENDDLRSQSRRTEEGFSEMEGKLNDLSREVSDLHAYLIKFQQDQISWITVSKNLPPHSEMVILLHKDKKESRGFLNGDKESWSLTSLGGPMKKVSLDAITHWKPFFTP